MSEQARIRRDRALVHGIAWSGGLKWATQVVTWALTILIARLLMPEDYGVFGMAMLYLGVVQLFNEAGIGAAIVQRRDLEAGDISELGGAAVVLGLACGLVTLVLAWPMALFFREPRLMAVIATLSLMFVGQSVQVLPRALMARDLRFRDVALLDMMDALVGSVLTVYLAYSGFAYWALVLGALGRTALTSIVAIIVFPYPLARPRHYARLRGALTFSRDFMAARLAWYGYSNADFAVVGRLLGTSALGAYTFGWNFSGLVVDKITAIVSQVVAPIFAAVQDDVGELRRYLMRLTFLLALITFPVSAGIAWVAPELVEVALGAKWQTAVLPLQLLSAYMGIRSVTVLLSQLMFATGNGRYGWRYNLVALCVLPPLFVIGAHWGTSGVAMAWVVGYPVIGFLFLRLASRIVEASPLEYFASLRPAIVGVVIMSAALMAFKYSPAQALDVRVRLVAEITTGALAYALALLLFYRAELVAARNSLRSMRGVVA